MAMALSNEFVVAAGMDKTWALLNDLERVAPCLPGAAITGRDGEDFLGEVKIKVGPIGANLKGTARMVETDESARRAVISMSGKDPKGGTATDATMRVQLEEVDATQTRVLLDTDLDISGRMAQFGRGAIADVSNRLIGQFTDNLGALVASDGGTGSQAAPAVNGTAISAGAPAATPAPVASAPADGLNVFAMIGPTIMRQALPGLIGLAIGLLVGGLRKRGGAPAAGAAPFDPWSDARLNTWFDMRFDARDSR